ncbi:hypothetical protein HF086_017443 [Spodoptera exigua]|uniref:Uncharacterized protein n=1 Tax=Spodoptera exigua TaxID=7107 RepID=A0A922SAG9_SPOEX|nr:hypothetical protein HF086_017443 [Spodoptera exigua]
MDAHGAAACSCGAGRELAPDGRACVPAAAACPAGQWGCAEGACIPDDLVCDGVPHCSDSPSASDEDLYYCTSRACGAGSVACGAGGRCVAAARACDGRADCDDGADEADCDCGAARYRCDDGACVPLAARCDRVQHCADGSDERDCPACLGPDCVPSDPTTTTTDSNAIETSTTETSREADEEEELCEGAQFRCGGGECVPLAWRCDGRADCPDGSDEATHCQGNTWTDETRELGTCSDRAPPSVPQSLYCDGDADCGDGSDEPAGCAGGGADASGGAGAGGGALCNAGALECAGRCVARELQCDGRDHCQDGGGSGAGSDEDPDLCASYERSLGAGELATARGECARGEWQCGNGACVARAALCDGADDCGDYTDESHCNVDECSFVNGECAHNCTELAVGRACWCRAGWRLAPDARACADVDECQEDEPCDHTCSLAEGNVPALAAVRGSLIFTNRYYIRRAALGAPGSSLLVHELSNAVALDMQWEERCLYWSDVTRLGSAIRRACGPAAAPHQLLHGATLQNPDGLAVDWVAGNLYWCDKGTDTIEVSRVDGRHRRVLLRGQLSEPRALALLPARGWLYWSDWGAAPHIGRAGMDGSGRQVLLSAGLYWPNALTLNPASQELYFADARQDYIAVADLDGRNVRVLFSRGTVGTDGVGGTE